MRLIVYFFNRVHKAFIQLQKVRQDRKTYVKNIVLQNEVKKKISSWKALSRKRRISSRLEIFCLYYVNEHSFLPDLFVFNRYLRYIHAISRNKHVLTEPK